MERAYTLADLARHAQARVEGDGTTLIRRVGTLSGAGPDAIGFLANPRYRDQLASTRAAAVILSPDAAGLTALPRLICDDPYVAYAKVAQLLHPPPQRVAGVHPGAHVDPSAVLDDDVSIGPGAVVGPNCRIGRGASIGALAVIGEEVTLAEQVIVDARVVIYERCVIGARTRIYAGAVIGADGFGMAEEAGRWVRIPQVGRVVVGADCEIGANTTIDRGAIDDTVLEDDVRLDNQIQIGHNCSIGAHTAIAGCVGIAGSTRIGRNCRIAGAAKIGGHLVVPDGTTISAATIVVEQLPAPGVYTSLFPVLPHRKWQRVAVALRHLDELARRLRELERASGKGGGA